MRSEPAEGGGAAGALDSNYGQFVLAGLVLCLLGDVLLIPRERPAVFRAGVFAFLLGHVAYSAAFVTRPLDLFGLAAGAVLLAVVVGGSLRWLAATLPSDMVWPVRVYMVVIGVMSTLACGVTAAGGTWAVAVCALAFTASDISGARGVKVLDKRHSHDTLYADKIHFFKVCQIRALFVVTILFMSCVG